MFSKITNYLALVTSIITASGVFVHDMRIDRAAMAATAPLPAAYETSSASKLLSSGDAHTHVERVSGALNDLAPKSPSVQPRSDDKKHLLQKRVAKGHHAFDNYNLPIV
jgi:hypothetical protein